MQPTAVPTFSDRIRRRWDSWWGPERGTARLHRAREILIARPGRAAGRRCCDRWQRALHNKLTARALAIEHGCRVPELFWTGRVPRLLPLSSLPRDVVIKPAFGHTSAGVHVLAGDRELISGETCARAALRAHLARRFGEVSAIALLAEELVREAGREVRVPTDYKLFVFGDHVGAIEAAERLGHDPFANPRGAYTADWTPLEPLLRPPEFARADFPPPSCLDEMLDVARRLGRAYGTFVRVDLYAGVRGAVFGELSSTPSRGRFLTEEADRFLGELWQQYLADRE